MRNKVLGRRKHFPSGCANSKYEFQWGLFKMFDAFSPPKLGLANHFRRLGRKVSFLHVKKRVSFVVIWGPLSSSKSIWSRNFIFNTFSNALQYSLFTYDSIKDDYSIRLKIPYDEKETLSHISSRKGASPFYLLIQLKSFWSRMDYFFTYIFVTRRILR